jgi:hypothetical protein
MLTFDDLYAFRLHYQDISFDEYYIIKKLKEQLYNSGMENEEEINNHIYDFYQKFGFSMSINEIKSVRFNNLSNTTTQSLFSYFTNILSTPLYDNNNDTEVTDINDNVNNSDAEYTTQPTNDDNNNDFNQNNFNISYQTFTFPLNPPNENIDINEFINNFNNILNSVLEQAPSPQEDIQVTMDHEDIDNLPVKRYSESNNINCSICLCDMEEGEEYFDIKCKHIFHKDCMFKWLEKFNYICPICRTELGKSHAHIDSSEENNINVE